MPPRYAVDFSHWGGRLIGETKTGTVYAYDWNELLHRVNRLTLARRRGLVWDLTVRRCGK
jgi:hypothetical protein